MRNFKNFCFSIFLIFLGILIGQNQEVREKVNLGTKKVNSFVKKSQARFNPTSAQQVSSGKSKLAKQWVYLYGTDSFDSSVNARCLIKDYEISVKKGIKTVSSDLFCQGNVKLQKKVRNKILARIEKEG